MIKLSDVIVLEWFDALLRCSNEVLEHFVNHTDRFPKSANLAWQAILALADD